MKRSYWEKMAPAYGEEIFDVLQNDRKGFITTAINTYCAPDKTVIDIGCAIGKWIPVLSPLFKQVVALDISAKNLAIAKRLHQQYTNVSYLRADMSNSRSRIPACDFGICINAILTPNQKDRDVFFNGLKRCIKKGGQLIATVPSLESWMLTSILQQQYGIDKKLFPAEKNSREALRKWNNLRKGNADIDEVPHKHYLREELPLLFSKAGFKVTGFEKIEYGWDTEFFNAPKWLTEPRPWDWMIVSKRK